MSECGSAQYTKIGDAGGVPLQGSNTSKCKKTFFFMKKAGLVCELYSR